LIKYIREYRRAVIDVERKVSRVNLKLKFIKGKYLPGSYDVGRFKDENFKKNFAGTVEHEAREPKI